MHGRTQLGEDYADEHTADQGSDQVNASTIEATDDIETTDAISAKTEVITCHPVGNRRVKIRQLKHKNAPWKKSFGPAGLCECVLRVNFMDIRLVKNVAAQTANRSLFYQVARWRLEDPEKFNELLTMVRAPKNERRKHARR